MEIQQAGPVTVSASKVLKNTDKTKLPNVALVYQVFTVLKPNQNCFQCMIMLCKTTIPRLNTEHFHIRPMSFFDLLTQSVLLFVR